MRPDTTSRSRPTPSRTTRSPVFQSGAKRHPSPRLLPSPPTGIPDRASAQPTNATLQPAGGIIIPSPGGSTSGCSSSDFAGFVPGRIALIQRGTCFFGEKALNAQAAGASGVVIFNEGNTPERSGVFSGSLVDANGNPVIPTIPVAFTSFAIG